MNPFISLFLVNLILQVKGFPDCDQAKTEKSQAEIKKTIPALSSYIEQTSYWNGEVIFLNYQDEHINLKCPNHKDVKDGSNKNSPYWRLYGFDQAWKANHESYEFAAKFHHSNKIRVTAPDPQGYYRDYGCFRRVNGDKKTPGCNHFFNVVTRPLPLTTFSVKMYEGGEIEFDCKPNPLLYKKSADKERKDPSLPGPRAQGPYKINWIVPDKLTKEQNDWRSSGGKGKKDTDANPMEDAEVEMSFPNGTVQVKIKDMNEGNVTYSKSTIVIKNAQKSAHAGTWECVVTDGNNVTSRMTYSSRLHEGRFKGWVTVHIRSKFWPWLALGLIIAFTIIIILLIKFAPENIEGYSRKDADAFNKKFKGKQKEEDRKKTGTANNANKTKTKASAAGKSKSRLKSK